MLELTLVILGVILHAWGSRQQGRGISIVGILTFGLASAAILNFFSLPLVIAFDLALAYWIGESAGWGDFFGAFLADREMVPRPHRKSWWQVHPILKTNKYVSSAFRGLIWALPLCVMVFLSGIPMLMVGYVLAFTTCFMVSIPLARETLKRYPDKITTHAWGLSEYFRGAYVTLVPFLVALILL